MVNKVIQRPDWNRKNDLPELPEPEGGPPTREKQGMKDVDRSINQSKIQNTQLTVNHVWNLLIFDFRFERRALHYKLKNKDKSPNLHRTKTLFLLLMLRSIPTIVLLYNQSKSFSLHHQSKFGTVSPILIEI